MVKEDKKKKRWLWQKTACAHFKWIFNLYSKGEYLDIKKWNILAYVELDSSPFIWYLLTSFLSRVVGWRKKEKNMKKKTIYSWKKQCHLKCLFIRFFDSVALFFAYSFFFYVCEFYFHLNSNHSQEWTFHCWWCRWRWMKWKGKMDEKKCVKKK